MKKMKIEDISKVMFKSAAEGLIVVDKKGIIQIANPSAELLFGYKKMELIGKQIETLIPDEYRHKHLSHRQEYNANPTRRPMGSGMNLQGKKKCGNVFPIEVSLNHFDFEGDKFVMALFFDIYKRKAILEELKKEKDLAQRYLDIAGTIFIIINKDQNVEVINKKGSKILGYTEEEIVGKNWFNNYIPKNQSKHILKEFQLFLIQKNNQFAQFESSILSKGGKKYIIAWNNVLLKDEKGNVTGTLSSGEDITEQKKTQERLINLNTKLEQKVKERTCELVENQRLYKMIARNFPNGVIKVLDSELNYVFVEGSELYKNGIQGDLLIGTNYLNRIDNSVKDALRKKLMNVFRGQNITFELELENNTYMLNAVGLVGLNKKINQILLVSQNISNLKKAELDIKNTLEKEKQLNKLKSRFVSTASHEFRTPLTTVLNSATLLSKSLGFNLGEETQRRNVDRIKNSVEYLISVLNDFLSLDKLEAGKVELNYTEFNLLEFTNKLIDQIEGMTKNGQQVVYTHVGKVNVFLDAHMLRNILNNLLSNAIKYSSENSNITLSTSTENNTLVIVVQDRGIGIPNNERHHLFEPFFRARNAQNIQGTGLGLNIIAKYLEILQGDITFETKINRGTTFTIKIPLTMKH